MHKPDIYRHSSTMYVRHMVEDLVSAENNKDNKEFTETLVQLGKPDTALCMLYASLGIPVCASLMLLQITLYAFELIWVLFSLWRLSIVSIALFSSIT